MALLLRAIVACALLTCSPLTMNFARANNIAITVSDLPASQIDPFYKTFAADFAFRPYEPATAWDEIWGVALGVSAGVTSLGQIQTTLVTVSTPYIPDADLIAVLAGPFGLAIEVGYVPKLNISGVGLFKIGGDAKWTFTELFGHQALPVDAAVRVMTGQTRINYSETIQGVSDTLAFTSKQTGFNLSVSKQLGFFEPYLGFGYITETGTLSDSGQISLFSQNVTLAATYSSSSSSAWFYGGAQLKASIFTLSVEYDLMFSSPSYGLKLGLKI